MARVEYSDKVWAQIKKEWLSGQLSETEISRNYGPSRPATRKHAKANNWPARGTLQEEVRREINTALITGQDPGQVAAQVTAQEEGEVIEGAARRGLAVVRAHRGLLHRLLEQAAVTLSEMEQMQLIKLELILKTRLKGRSKLVTAIIGNRIDAMEAVARTLAKAIPLERHAFSLDSDGGELQPITYVTPEMNKPKGTGLSQDEWEEDHGQGPGTF